MTTLCVCVWDRSSLEFDLIHHSLVTPSARIAVEGMKIVTTTTTKQAKEIKPTRDGWEEMARSTADVKALHPLVKVCKRSIRATHVMDG